MGNKYKSALYAALVPGGVCFASELFEGRFPHEFVFVTIFTAIGNLVYGIPVSLLSDIITKKLIRSRFIVAAWIHIFFGFLTVFLIRNLVLFSVVCALLFFLFDEWQKSREQKGKNPPIFTLLNVCATILFLALAVWSSNHIIKIFEEKDKTYNSYFIPKGYLGKVTVVYDVKHAHKPEKIDGYDVIKINEKGYAIISSPENESIIEDKYFYIDEKGQKEEIDQNCIDNEGWGEIMGEEYRYRYYHFYVTNICKEPFVNGEDFPFSEGLTLEEILIEEGLVDTD